MQVISYAIQAPAPPYPVFVLSYVILGFAISIQVYLNFDEVYIFYADCP